MTDAAAGAGILDPNVRAAPARRRRNSWKSCFANYAGERAARQGLLQTSARFRIAATMSYETTDPTGAKELLDGDDGWIPVDVRTVAEFEEGHVPGAYNVPFAFKGPFGMEPNPEFAATIARLFPRDARLVFV